MDTLNVVGAQRQRVKFAAKLLSNTMSKAITRCGTLGHLPPDMNWAVCTFFPTSNICNYVTADRFLCLLVFQVNDWFDVFNNKALVSTNLLQKTGPSRISSKITHVHHMINQKIPSMPISIVISLFRKLYLFSTNNIHILQ